MKKELRNYLCTTIPTKSLEPAPKCDAEHHEHNAQRDRRDAGLAQLIELRRGHGVALPVNRLGVEVRC